MTEYKLSVPTIDIGWNPKPLFSEVDIILLEGVRENLEKAYLESVSYKEWGGSMLSYIPKIAILHILPERWIEDQEEQVLETLHQKVNRLIDIDIDWSMGVPENYRFYMGDIKIFDYLFQQLGRGSGSVYVFYTLNLFLKKGCPALYPDYYRSDKQNG